MKEEKKPASDIPSDDLTKPKDAKRKYQYVGPEYTLGISMRNGRRYDLKNLSDLQVEKLIKTNPEVAPYFKQI